MASSLLLKPITSDLLTVEGQCIDPSKTPWMCWECNQKSFHTLQCNIQG